MEIVDLVQAAESSELSPRPSVRKMKQSRLLFQVISPGLTSTADATKTSDNLTETRKRKPSNEEIELVHVAKFGRVSAKKENVTTDTGIEIFDDTKSTVKGKSQKTLPESVDVSTDQPTNSSSTNNAKNLAKRFKKRITKKHDSDKILIKLPIGKRKRIAKRGTKSQIKSPNCSDVNLSGTSGEKIQLDDTDLSEENEEDQTGYRIEVPSTSTIVNESESLPNKLLSLKKQSEDSPKRQSRQSENMSQTVETRTESPSSAKTDNQLSTECQPDQHQKKSGSFTLANFFTKVEESNKKAKVTTDINSDINDSSEEDIYMLCTPNSKIIPISDKRQNLTPKQIARRQEHEKRQALKMQEKEEKRRKLLEEKEEKARDKEDQERQRRRYREEKEEMKRKDREEKEEMKRKERDEKEEIRRKEREEKEDQKRKEREEKEKKRQAEMEQKNEERRQKEEERRKREEQREEERKRKEEEKEVEEKRKQKVAQAFTSFFVKRTSNGGGLCKASEDENSTDSSLGLSTAPSIAIDQQRFMPFCVKGDMRLAPIIRKVLEPFEKENLRQVLSNRSGKSDVALNDLYLGLLKRHCHRPLKADRTWSVEEEEEGNEDIMIVDESVCHEIEEDPGKTGQKFKAKFFLFEENRRPPFRGTWRKKSSCISARRPFAQDTKYFDYELDSDDEWEEEEPGESLHGSDDEKDVDPEEDYEVDNEFFVPHGHLSDEELQAEEEGGMDDNSPEVQKAKLKIMQQEFVAEMKKKTEKIKPRLIGCIWENVENSIDADDIDGGRTAECSTIIWKLLKDRAMLYDVNEAISFTLSSSALIGNGNGVDHDAESSSPGKENEKGSKKVRITDDAIKDLVRLVHGNVNNRKFLVREFQAFWLNRNDAAVDEDSGRQQEELRLKGSARENAVEFSLESIRNKIREIAEWGACPVEGPMMGKLCWTVDNDVLEHYDLQELNMPNCWKYKLKGNKQPRLKIKVPVNKEENRKHLKSVPKKKGSMIRVAKHEGDRSRKAPSNGVASPMPAITKFTKVVSKDEEMSRVVFTENLPKRSKIEDSPTEGVTGIAHEKETSATTFDGNNSSGQKKTKKRVQLLMTVPRGQTVNQSTKNNLIRQFLVKGSLKTMKLLEKETKCTDNKTLIEID